MIDLSTRFTQKACEKGFHANKDKDIPVTVFLELFDNCYSYGELV